MLSPVSPPSGSLNWAWGFSTQEILQETKLYVQHDHTGKKRLEGNSLECCKQLL